MALGTIPLGPEAEIHAATATLALGVYTAGTYKVVDGLTSWGKSNTRQTTKTTIYMRGTQLSQVGRPGRTVNLGGFISVADDGQMILRAAAESQDVIALKIQPDGTNGWECFGTVATQNDDGNNADNSPNTSFTVELVVDPTIVGAGL